MKNRVWLRLLVSLLFVTVALSMFACTDRNPASTVTTAPPSNVETTEPDNTDSNATESDTTRSETTESGTTESGTADPGTTETTDPGTTDPGTTETTDTGDTTETEVIPGPYIPADPNVETKGEETTEEPQKGCHPRYAWNEGYHWSPACDVCGKSEGNKIAHTGYCTVEDEGDVLMYSYFCMRCEATIGRLEIPYDVDLYFDPMTLAESKGDFVEVVGSAFSSAEGTPSARFTSVDNTGRYVTIYEDPNTSTPTGKYLAMKIKLRSGRSSFRLSVSSIEGNKTGSPMFVALKGLTPGWASVIVDLSKICEGTRGYVPDAAGDYYLYTLNLYMDGNSALSTGDYFNLAFAAICSDIDDAKDFFENDNAIYIYDDLGNSSHPTIEGTPCEHVYTYPDDNHHSSAPCDVCKDEGGVITHKYEVVQLRDDVSKTTSHYLECLCGYETKPLVVSDDINYFSAPGQIYNNWATYADQSPTGSTVMTTGIVMSEEDVLFTRVGLDNGASLEFTNGTLSPVVRNYGVGQMLSTNYGYDEGDTISGGSGRYIVLKTRSSGINQIRLVLNDGLSSEFYVTAFKFIGRSSKEITSGEWTTYCIDIAALNVPYYTAENLDLEHAAFGLHFQNNGLSETEDVIEYIDIAYFAVCDDWDEVVSITGEDQVLFTNWSNPAADVLRNPDGSCVKCVGSLLSVEGNTYIYGCSGCRDEFERRTVPTDINYYSAPGQYYNNWSTGINQDTLCRAAGSFIYDEEGGFVYNHLNLYQGANFEFTNGSVSPKRGFAVNGVRSEGSTEVDVGDTIKNGSGKFFVLKMRGTDIEYVDFIVNGDDDNGGVATYTNKIRRVANDISDDLWTVYVIDIEKMAAEHYAAMKSDVSRICVGLQTDEGSYNPSTGLGAKLTETMDIAYFAICNSWEQIAAVVGDEIVVYTDWKTPANDELRKSNGDATCQHESWGDYESDATAHWQNACTVCNEKIDQTPHKWKYWDKNRKCTTCGYSETCTSDEHYAIDANGHRIKETCDICQMTEEQNASEHDWQYGIKSRVCTTCGYDETCTVNHFVFDENGHTVDENCPICQLTQQTTKVPHEWEYSRRSRKCTVCGYSESCDKNHYASSANGHRVKEDCAICQVTAQSENTPHAERKLVFISKGETTTTYTLGCYDCGYGADTWTIPNDVNFYSVPGLQTNNYNTGGPSVVQGEYIFSIDRYTSGSESFLYNRIDFNTSGSVKLSNGTGGSGKTNGRFLVLNDTISGGSGKYAVMKIRVGGTSIGWLSFGSWDGSGSPASADNVFRRDNSPNLRGASKFQIGEWVTYVINLSKIDTKYYVAENGELTHAAFGFQIQPGVGGTETDYVDIAYFAICDDITEVGYVVGNDTVSYLDSWAGSEGVNMTCHKGVHSFGEGTNICSICGYERVCDNSDGHYEITAAGHKIIEDCEICGISKQDTVEAHSADATTLEMISEQSATTYKYHCKICGYEMRSWTVSNDVNYYSAPTQVYNNWASGGDGSKCVATGTLSSDCIYNRIELGQGASFEFVNGTLKTPIRSFGVQQDTSAGYDGGDTIKGGSGKYFVLKYRVHGPSALRFLVNSNNPDSVWNLSNPGTALVSTRNVSETQDVWRVIVVDIESLGSNYYHGEDENVTNVAIGMYFDVWVGTDVVDEASRYIDIAYFAVCDNITEVTAVVGQESNVELISDWKAGAAGKMECHTGGHTFNQSTGKCVVCGETATMDVSGNKVFTGEINLYTAPGTINTNHSWSCSSNIGHVSYDPTSGDLYQRINVANAGGTIPLTAFGHPSDSKNNSTGASGSDGYTDGAGQSLVGGAGKYFVLRMRTNSKEALGWKISTADSEGAIQHTDGYTARRETNILETDEWTTYVIDIEKMVAAASITTYDDANAPAGVFCLKYGNGNTSGVRGGEYLDIAYFAVVDSWAEVAEVTGSDAEVLYTNWDNANDDAYVTVSDKVAAENAQ